MYNYKYINFESSSTIISIDKLIQGQTAESKVIGSNQIMSIFFFFFLWFFASKGNINLYNHSL